MIEKIEIEIRNGPRLKLDGEIDFLKNTYRKNDTTYSITEEFKNKIIQTIYKWKEEYGKDAKIDSEEFFITVKSTDAITTFHGKGKYPENYENLKELLGEEK